MVYKQHKEQRFIFYSSRGWEGQAQEAGILQGPLPMTTQKARQRQREREKERERQKELVEEAEMPSLKYTCY